MAAIKTQTTLDKIFIEALKIQQFLYHCILLDKPKRALDKRIQILSLFNYIMWIIVQCNVMEAKLVL